MEKISTMDLVTVDIGGTHARFALAQIMNDGTIEIDEPETLETSDHASFQTAWEDFSVRKGGSLPAKVAMAVAGPVKNDLIRFTNNPWIIRPPLIRDKLGCEKYTIVNDFAAVAHAAARASDQQFLHLAGPDIPFPNKGTISVVGPGTGLGVAYFYRESLGDYRVQSTEGGHGDYASLDSIEDAILSHLRKRHNRVSDERVVSGPAIIDIYQTLAGLEHRSIEPDLDDKEIWARGISGKDSIAAAAIDRFCLALGSIAGDIALVQGANGVVIAGGLGFRIRDALVASGFAERFSSKGRFSGMMGEIPVKLIVHPQPGLYGAAAAFAREHLR